MTEAQAKPLPEICTPEELLWLGTMAGNNGYIAPAPMGNGRWCAIYPFAFTAGIITGRMGDNAGYEDRWCFENIALALRALHDWAGKDCAGSTHALRIDRYGNIWASDAYWNVLWKLNPKGEVLMMLGKRGENGAWNDAAWNG